MGITIVVDANIILSALLGGKPSSILFDLDFEKARYPKILKTYNFIEWKQKAELGSTEKLSLLYMSIVKSLSWQNAMS